MKKIGIMTDSHSGILKKEADELGIQVLSMPFFIEGEIYHEDVDISKEEFYEKLREGITVATSQPSPQEVMSMWDGMLKEYEQVLYIPISSGLSGSCMTAKAMAGEPEYAGKVYVVDCGRVSTVLHRTVLDAVEMVEEGYSAIEIQRILESSRDKMIIYVGLSTLEYLKKGGRIKPAAAAVATVLNIKPVMRFGVGKLDIYQKCRGVKRTRKAMIDAMKQELATNFKDEYHAGNIYLLAASSCSQEVTDDWVKQIKKEFPGMDVLCDDLSFGLACHIGPDGLGIGCSVKPIEIAGNSK